LTKQPDQVHRPLAPEGDGAPEITPAMRSAGVDAFDEFSGSFATAELVVAVYTAMRALEPPCRVVDSHPEFAAPKRIG
jgi:hypothetical protein